MRTIEFSGAQICIIFFIVSQTATSCSSFSNFATLSSLSFPAFNSLQFCLGQFSKRRSSILWREEFL